jgi:hypothetical protein
MDNKYKERGMGRERWKRDGGIEMEEGWRDREIEGGRDREIEGGRERGSKR